LAEVEETAAVSASGQVNLDRPSCSSLEGGTWQCSRRDTCSRQPGDPPEAHPRPGCSGAVLSRAAHHVEREEEDPQNQATYEPRFGRLEDECAYPYHDGCSLIDAAWRPRRPIGQLRGSPGARGLERAPLACPNSMAACRGISRHGSRSAGGAGWSRLLRPAGVQKHSPRERLVVGASR
jgi:hypothetical protein